MPGITPADPNNRSTRATLSTRTAPEAFRVLDWSNLDVPPSPADLMRMAGLGGREGAARLAVIVASPRMLRAANVFAEQAGMQGAQVRVFIDSREAVAWLYKDMPQDMLGHEWPVARPAFKLPPLEKRADPVEPETPTAIVKRVWR